MASHGTSHHRKASPGAAERVRAAVHGEIARLPPLGEWSPPLKMGGDRFGFPPETSEWVRRAEGVEDALWDSSSPRQRTPDRRRFWRHAVTVAVAAEALHSTATGAATFDAFAAGLFHDFGKLVLARVIPRGYGRAAGYADLRGLRACTVERQQLGIDHAEAGEALARHWSFPESLRDAIAWHHEPLNRELDHRAHGAVIAAVALADGWAHEEQFGHPSRRDALEMSLLAARLGIAEEAARAIRGAARERAMFLLDACSGGLGLEGTGGAPSRRRRETPSHGVPSDTSVVDACWAALGSFSRSAAEATDPVMLSRALAASAASGLGAARLVGFVVESASGAGHCCAWSAKGAEFATVLLAGDGVEGESPDRVPSSETGGGVRLIPVSLRPIGERFRHVLMDDEPWFLPLHGRGRFLGGLLWDHAPERRRPGRGMATPLGEFAEVLGALLDGALSNFAGNLRRSAPIREGGVSGGATSSPAAWPAIAAMAAGAAHELNTPLAVIVGRAQSLAKQTEDAHRRLALETIAEQGHHCSRIVSELLALAKPEPPTPRRVVVADWLEAWRTTNLQRSVRPGKGLGIHLVDPSVTVWADPGQLRLVFDALLDNAWAASAATAAAVMVNSRSWASDETVVIAVQDRGGGMSEEVWRHACDPFFSHREAGRGRGLGLALAKRLVELNAGRLWVESAPGAGTSVFVELPATATD